MAWSSGIAVKHGALGYGASVATIWYSLHDAFSISSRNRLRPAPRPSFQTSTSMQSASISKGTRGAARALMDRAVLAQGSHPV